jgi:hypothetical protein
MRGLSVFDHYHGDAVIPKVSVFCEYGVIILEIITPLFKKNTVYGVMRAAFLPQISIFLPNMG